MSPSGNEYVMDGVFTITNWAFEFPNLAVDFEVWGFEMRWTQENNVCFEIIGDDLGR